VARVEYSRIDLPVRVDREGMKAVIRLGDGFRSELIVAIDRLWAGEVQPQEFFERLADLDRDAFRTSGDSPSVWHRIALDVRDEELAGFSW